MKTLYTDASFDYRHTTETEENVVRGKIAVSDGAQFNRVDKVAIGKVDGLLQYINVLELTAIARAVELASEETPKVDALTVITDSMTAMYWARRGRIKKKGIETAAHTSALEYLHKARLQFGGEITFNQVSREQNPAGKLLEAELERERPHAI